jgi:localization factor PodJL
MVSEASWQRGAAGRTGDARAAQRPMDQLSVESLLRRLVRRIEESERRYGEALDELHARLDQLSQTTDAARTSGASESGAALDRLHDQMSSLANRLERETSNPLDDFERLGKALSGGMDHGTGAGGFTSSAAGELGPSPYGSRPLLELPVGTEPPFSFWLPESPYSVPPTEKFSTATEDRDLDKRLVDVAHRLEHSIETTMSTTVLEALNARLDEIGHQISQALLRTPKLPSLEPLELQISDLAQKLNRAEEQLARIGSIESELHGLIERVDASPDDVEELVSRTANEAARLVAAEAKQSTAERLDAMHRDLMAMNDRTRASDDRMTSTITAVQESLKQLAQQVERGAPQALQSPRPRALFAERTQAEAERAQPPQRAPGVSAQQPFAETRIEKGAARENGDPSGTGALVKHKTLRTRLTADAPVRDATEVAPPFGRAKRVRPGDEAFDLDAAARSGPLPDAGRDAKFETPNDLVAAARRAAQAAARKAEERMGGPRGRPVAAAPIKDASASAEQPWGQKRPLLIVAAAVLLAISAALLYERLRLKPEPVVSPPAVEQSAPAPGDSNQGTPALGADESAPAPAEPNAETPPAQSDSWEPLPQTQQDPDKKAEGDGGASRNFTEVAKSAYRPAADDAATRLQPASLKPEGQVSLPPGVVFFVEEPGKAPAPMAAGEPSQPEDSSDASEETNSSLITRAQALLNELGYDVGAPDGQMGARTREAIKSFERRYGLEETGKVTILLVTKLERLTS